MLTQFVMPVSELKHAQSVFTDGIKSFEIKNAFVPKNIGKRRVCY